VEAGRKVEDLARECGVSKHTVYAWKSKYGGMDVSDRLKKLVADLSLDKYMLLSS
jgi:putative transposase